MPIFAPTRTPKSVVGCLGQVRGQWDKGKPPGLGKGKKPPAKPPRHG